MPDSRSFNDPDPRNQTNDEFGYAVYSVWVYGTVAQIDEIGQLRRTISARRDLLPAYIHAGAHVTVKRLFRGISDLSTVAQATQDIAQASHPFFIELEQVPVEWGEGNHTCAIRAKVSGTLKTLNARLESAIRPLCVQNFGESLYAPHMTIYQDATATEVERGRELAYGLNLGSGFPVQTLELVGRVGPFASGHWVSLGSFPLTGKSDLHSVARLDPQSGPDNRRT